MIIENLIIKHLRVAAENIHNSNNHRKIGKNLKNLLELFMICNNMVDKMNNINNNSSIKNSQITKRRIDIIAMILREKLRQPLINFIKILIFIQTKEIVLRMRLPPNLIVEL